MCLYQKDESMKRDEIVTLLKEHNYSYEEKENKIVVKISSKLRLTLSFENGKFHQYTETALFFGYKKEISLKRYYLRSILGAIASVALFVAMFLLPIDGASASLSFSKVGIFVLLLIASVIVNFIGVNFRMSRAKERLELQ